MKTTRLICRDGSLWTSPNDDSPDITAQLVLMFGPRVLLTENAFAALAKRCPDARIVTCSTSGDITNSTVTDDRLTGVGIEFEGTEVSSAAVDIEDCGDSYEAGKRLAEELSRDNLAHVLVFSDGQKVNGAQLARGMCTSLPANVKVSGGLAGDGTDFVETAVGLNETPRSGRIVAIGFYGDRLSIGCASGGGWQAFGPERTVTRSEGNVLYEFDGEPALGIYKKYLGEQASGLPASALRFPLSIWTEDGNEPVVRTILNIDENVGSMTFAGEIPTGAKVHFMRGVLEELIDGASSAAEAALGERSPDLALCISCVGRRIVFGQRIEEELEEVQDALGGAELTGFYSYGELGPTVATSQCLLHNQTISITTFSEN